MSAGVADILCISQITYIIVHNTLLANYGWFWLSHLEVLTHSWTPVEGCDRFFCVDLTIASSLRQLTFDPFWAKPLGEPYFRWWTELALQFLFYAFHFTLHHLVEYILSCQILFFSLENDDMESSKHCAQFFLVVLITKCNNYICWKWWRETDNNY